jgi:gliding motility-associated-like protein
MEYVIEVLNEFNCSASDTIQVKAGCGEKNIFIPTAFTPNADGLNDRFTIHGTGVSMIRSLRVYNRWGEMIYEKRNFYPGDNSSSWDGRFMGREAPAAAYVYFAELECGAGNVFSRKGTITLVR